MSSVAERLARLPASERAAVLSDLTEAEAEALLYDWRGFNARPEQIAPDGDWDIWLVLAGRGFGKTRTGAEMVREEVESARSGRIGLIAETAADARDVMVAELLRIFPKDQRPVYKSSKRSITFHNGAEAFTYNATEPDQLRGPQHDFIWCFVAGTQVETIRGPVPIERVQSGELVLTRAGYRRVQAAGSRRKPVGKVTFANGAELVGTADHLVYTSLGWMRLDQLCEGVQACATDVSSGAGSVGISTAKAVGLTTSGPSNQAGAGKAGGCIGTFGPPLSALFRKALTFTTLTATALTTTLAILPLFQSGLTPVFTQSNHQSRARHGKKSRWLPANAQVVATRYIERQSENQSATVARLGAERAADCGPNGPACNAARHLEAVPETFAVNVASTWQPAGEQDVFCLTVEGQPEYFANGILVHNCDELAKWRYARECWDQAQFGLRLGQHPRQIVTTTPRPIELIKAIVGGQEGSVHVTRGSTMDNRTNLAESFLDRIQKRYAGTRLGRQELNAEILGDLPGALWSMATLDGYRLREAPKLKRIVVAVDPAVTNTEASDEHGLIVAGVSEDQRGIVLEDASLSGSPTEWARRAVSLYRSWDADGIVVEVNQGGDMVAHTIRTIDPTAHIIEVRASRGKHVRAEPIAALYEQGKIAHVGAFPVLESQMTQMTTSGYEGDGSPDRVDALVWAMTELFPGMTERVADASKFAIPASRGWMR